jgi:thiol-disulfide isomerase/thioredoxin
MKSLLASLLTGFLMVAVGSADERAASSSYIVDEYDPKRDPTDDIKTAVVKAKSSGKHILVQVGGDWCGWCHLMSKYFNENEKVAAALAKNYLIVKVNYSDENQNEAFLKQYPPIPSYPFIYILNSDGKLLHAQRTDPLEEGKGYSEERMLAFLDTWAPKQ